MDRKRIAQSWHEYSGRPLALYITQQDEGNRQVFRAEVGGAGLEVASCSTESEAKACAELWLREMKGHRCTDRCTGWAPIPTGAKTEPRGAAARPAPSSR